MTNKTNIKRPSFEGKHHTEETKQKLREKALRRSAAYREIVRECEASQDSMRAELEEMAEAEKAREDSVYQQLWDEHFKQEQKELEALEKQVEEYKAKMKLETRLFLKELWEKDGIDSDTIAKFLEVYDRMPYEPLRIARTGGK